MSPFLIAILLLLGIGSQGEWLMTPETRYELGLKENRPPPCRPATRAELSKDGLAPVGKASTFNLKGFWVCEARAVRFGDRDTFADYVSQHAVKKAQAIARSLAQEDRAAPSVWTVEVEADDPEVKRYVETIWRTELVQALGSGRVARRGGDPEVRRLVISVRRVQDASLLFGVYAFDRPKIAGEPAAWRAL